MEFIKFWGMTACLLFIAENPNYVYVLKYLHQVLNATLLAGRCISIVCH